MRLAAKHIFISILSFFIIFSVSYIPAHAQTIPESSTNMHTYTQNVFIDVMGGLGCLLAGIDITSPHQPCVTNSTNSDSPTSYNVKSSGLIGTFASLSGTLFTPPIHTSDYTSDLASHFGLTQKAYAQGVGFTSLNPLITIWKVFRNIAYLFFVIIFVLVGFGIMFRFNIDPRTVMSIENQLPKLIIGLILVTFSFAIAGLLIDFMWVLTFFVINLFTNLDCQLVKCTGDLTGNITGNIFQNTFGFLDKAVPGGFMGTAAGVGGSIGDVIRGLFTANNSSQLGLIPPINNDTLQSDPTCTTNFLCGLSAFFSNIVVGDLGSLLAFLLSWVISILGILVVLVVLLVSMFRLWFSLIMAYGYILIDVLLGPFFILFGMIPNSKISFSSWAKDLLANLLIFPSIIAVFLLARILMDAFSTNQQALFVPPLIGNPNGASGGVNPLGFIFAFVAILVAPNVQMLWQGVFGIEPGKLGSAIGQSVAGGLGLLMGGAKNTGRTIMGQKEYVLGAGGHSVKRGWVNSIFGGILGR